MDKAPAAHIALDNASLNNLGKWMVMLILGVRFMHLFNDNHETNLGCPGN